MDPIFSKKLSEADLKKIRKKLKDIDWSKIEREKKEKEEKAIKEEEDRINAIKCPSCKSTNKQLNEKRDSNGIIGYGYQSWVVDAYFVCKECGTMFKDLKKMEE